MFLPKKKSKAEIRPKKRPKKKWEGRWVMLTNKNRKIGHRERPIQKTKKKKKKKKKIGKGGANVKIKGPSHI